MKFKGKIDGSNIIIYIGDCSNRRYSSKEEPHPYKCKITGNICEHGFHDDCPLDDVE